MAARKSSVSSSFILLLVAALLVHVAYGDGEGSLKPEECAGACNYRCLDTHYKNACLEFCNKCCAKCLCVPSGTYGHKEECPCYNNWKTKEGTPKCP